MSQDQQPYTDETLMPFGAHKGTKLANVPAHYLLWCYKQTWCKPQLKSYIFDNMDVLNAENSVNNRNNFTQKFRP